jgi:hypothetical protein
MLKVRIASQRLQEGNRSISVSYGTEAFFTNMKYTRVCQALFASARAYS